MNWEQANTYCAYSGQQQGISKSLPSEADWKQALQDLVDVNATAWTDREGSKPIGTTPSDQTTSGLFDLLGNVQEWSSTSVDNGVNMLILGHSFFGEGSHEDLGKARPGRANYNVGFRCASDSVETP